MLIEISILNDSTKDLCNKVIDKQQAIYSISDTELKKARIQRSIGIAEPRVNVNKLRIKMASIKNVIFLNDSKAMRLYKDDQGFYLKELGW